VAILASRTRPPNLPNDSVRPSLDRWRCACARASVAVSALSRYLSKSNFPRCTITIVIEPLSHLAAPKVHCRIAAMLKKNGHRGEVEIPVSPAAVFFKLRIRDTPHEKRKRPRSDLARQSRAAYGRRSWQPSAPSSFSPSRRGSIEFWFTYSGYGSHKASNLLRTSHTAR
jgi:hypothetical protein